MFEQFPSGFYPYIIDVVDVVVDGHCGYRVVVASLGIGEKLHDVVRMILLKELSQCCNEYVKLFRGEHCFEYLKNSLIVDRMFVV